ncbi:DUF2922 domain-containing protein [Neobacillus sp. NPDC093127]|uniref:DUF2922 domain-containing protein n=1 Tax=Neobacillus sp. NPDC093127 TaxID=3364296 RepID=UPI00381DBAAF
MAKTLELQFGTEFGKTANISVDNPREPINEVLVKQSMEQIIASGVFTTAGGMLATVKGAKVIERNVTDYELV